MIDQFQWFCAVLMVIATAVILGAAVYGFIDLLTGGVKRASRLRRNAMPKRIREGN